MKIKFFNKMPRPNGFWTVYPLFFSSKRMTFISQVNYIKIANDSFNTLEFIITNSMTYVFRVEFYLKIKDYDLNIDFSILTKENK